jgi:hypothetical protein
LNKAIHIVAFDVPYPPNYGGVIDVFYKIKTLHQAGVNITLHCFDYGKGKQTELEKYCTKVFYYARKTGAHHLLSPLPYIVASRTSNELMKNLLADNHPILFEGLHCCYYLGDERLRDRKKLVRTHNIEHKYYSSLAVSEKKFFKKGYFIREAGKLKKFQDVLTHANHILAISASDAKELSGHYKNVCCVSAFHAHNQVDIKMGKGFFALYHGNLKVNENNQAALYLVKHVFNDLLVPFIIAGNGASAELKKAIAGKNHIELKETISTEEILQLVQDAQLNILPTFQATGIKLKLLAALFTGRHCLVNSPMVINTGLEPLCRVTDSAQQMKKEILHCMEIDFNSTEIVKREQLLQAHFSNQAGVEKLLGLI